jgi:hypothetical protein
MTNAPHRRVDRLGGIFLAMADGDALSLGQAGRLDHDRQRAVGDVKISGVRVGEAFCLRRRDCRLAHNRLGEGFVRLKSGRVPVGAEHAHPLLAQGISQTHCQGILRPDDRQFHVILPAEFDRGVNIRGIDGDRRGLVGDAGIAGGGEEGVDARALAKAPGQGVLASATAEDCDVDSSHCAGDP